MRVIGLTGGIGSGKSEASRRFRADGIPSVDADAIGHSLLEPGGAAVDAVVAAFGADVLSAGGGVDRARLAAKVFGDDGAVAQLNAITHPLIGMEIARQCAAFAEAGAGVVIVDAALIAEHGRLDGYLQGLILVLCQDDVRLQRLMTLRGMPREEALRRMGNQTPPERKIPLADWVIENGGTIEDLHRQVDAIACALKEKEA